LAGILNSELDPQVAVPVGIKFQFTFANPLGVVFDNAFDFEVVGNIEFVQSDPDREKFVPSFGVEPDLAPQGFHRLGLDADVLLPAIKIGQKEAVVFRRPTVGTIGPVGTDQM